MMHDLLSGSNSASSKGDVTDSCNDAFLFDAGFFKRLQKGNRS